MLLSTVSTVSVTVMAASINKTDVSIYYLQEDYAEKLTMPSGYNKNFQLSVTGASKVNYKVVSGRTATVSSSGLVEPKSTTWYYYGSVGTTFPQSGKTPTKIVNKYEAGDTVIQVTADSQTFNVTVHVNDYAPIYADKVMDDYIKKNVKSSMTDAQKIEHCAKFAASYDYSVSYSNATAMIVFGGGDCWASTDAVIKMANKMGFDAWARNGNKDPGAAGSGHMNAMVLSSDGTYYQLDAGFVATAPRTYICKKRTSLFSYTNVTGGISVYQYDGKTVPAKLEVPKTIDGKTIVEIGKGFLSSCKTVKTVVLPSTVKTIADSAFNSCENLENITLPASLTTLGNFVFTKCNKLTNIKSNSSNFTVANGVIYNKDKTVILYAPAVSEISIPSTVKTINDYAFYHNYNIKSVTIPSTVTALNECAFCYCTSLENVTLTNGKLTTLGRAVFGNCTKLTRVVIPASVTSIGEGLFNACTKLTSVTVLSKNCTIYDTKTAFPTKTVLYGYNNSTLQNYATSYDRTFVSIDNCQHTSTVDIVKKAPTCSAAGTKDVKCLACDKVIKSNVAIAKLAHQEVIDVNAVPATCTTEGKTKGSHCSLCNAVLSTSAVIPKTGHKYSSVITTPATCTREGVKTYTCSVCKDSYSESIAKTAHKLVTDNAVTATCTSTGLTEGKHCSVCGTVTVKQTVVAKNPNNHTNVVQDKAVEATCTKTGLTAGSHCTTCNQTVVKQNVVAKNPNNHTNVVQDKAVEATCTKTGLTAGSHCTVCNQTVVKQNVVAKNPNNHTNVVKDSAVAPTCTENGKTEGSHCVDCNKVITAQKVIAKTGHKTEWKSEDYILVKICTVCNDELARLPFKDLSDIDYRQYGDYIEYTSVNNQFITGTNPPERTLFSPTAPITRAMFVTILYRMAGEPYKNANPYESSPFTDITDTSVYYYDAACWALKNGITTETTFKPFDNVSREQTASFLFRYAKDNGKLGDSAYKNVNLAAYPDYSSVHGWAVEAMQWANYNGMITGTQQGYINPQGATQRIHATKILYGFGKTCNIGNFG